MRRLFLDNLPLKIFALIASLVLFAAVQRDRGTVTSIEVPILVRVPSGFVLTEEPPATASVIIRARASKLKVLRIDEIGPLSLSPVGTPGRTKVSFRPEMLSLPAGVEVESFQPPSVTLTLESMSTRSVQVSADRALSGAPPPGYQLGEVKFTPAQVEIVGPSSVVEVVNQVFVEPIDLTGRTRAFTVDRWVVPDRRGIKISGSARVSVQIDIVPKARERVVLGVPLLAVNLDRPYEIIPSTIDLVLVGEDEALSHIDPAKLVVSIDGSEDQLAPPRSRQLQVSPQDVFNLPPGVGVNDSKLPTIFLRTLPEVVPEIPRPVLGPEEDPAAPDEAPDPSP